MRKSMLGCLLLLPLAAFARDQCEHSKPLDLALDLSGIDTVVFDVGPHDLKLEATPGAQARLQGRACASSAARLDQLSVTRQRVGDKLVVSMAREDNDGFFGLFQSRYGYLELHGTLPDNVAVEIDAGSGDVAVSGVAELQVGVGSGDVDIHQIPGAVTASVGSGDILIDQVGSLRVESIGSGDLGGHRISGDASIGSVGSGDVELSDIGGDVEVGSIGSGDLDADTVRGNLHVRSIGSGDISHRGVGGRVDVPSEQ